MKTVKILPIGGLGEIGLNCMALEHDDELLVIDCGVMFSDLQMLGVDFMIPDMSYLKANRDKLKGYLITHAHEDHIGALPFAIKAHPAPIYCTKFARRLIETKLEEHDLLARAVFHEIGYGETLSFRHFQVRAIPVNHSIVEAMALLIDSPAGRIVFTGDFKIDTNPYYGEPMDLGPFQEFGDKGVALLMSDSTNVEREGHSMSEDQIFDTFERTFRAQRGLIVIAVFASNIARIGQIVELASKLKKKVALLGRSMEQNARIAHELGYLEQLPEVLIDVDSIENHARKDCIVISTGSQGEYRSALARIAAGEHKTIRLGEGDLVVLSSKFIPGNEKAIGRMINSLFMQGADVMYESVANIHVSGHANAEELRKMLRATRPSFFIPVHGEYRHLVRHAKLARECGVKSDHALIAVNGDVLELTKQSLKIVDHLEENRVFIEGEGGRDVSKVVIKDRRKVAETGVVFSVLIRNSVTGKLMAEPDVISRGFLELDNPEHAKIMRRAKDVVASILEDVTSASKSKSLDLQEEVRVGLRRFFNQTTGKKPVVLPILVDV